MLRDADGVLETHREWPPSSQNPTGPGSVLSVEGSIRRTSQEQTRLATYEERLGAEVVAESFEEMQERLTRDPHRPGYRDVTGEAVVDEAGEEEEVEGGEADDDPVKVEGYRRGAPRARRDDGAGDGERAGVPQEEMEIEQEEVGSRGGSEERLSSSLPEPEVEDNMSRQRTEQSVNAVRENMNLNNLPIQNFKPVRRAVDHQWRRNADQPYFNEVFLGTFPEVEEVTQEHKGEDYWIFDPIKEVIQRHHVKERNARFKPVEVRTCPISLRAISKTTLTKGWRQRSIESHKLVPRNRNFKQIGNARQSLNSLNTRSVLCLPSPGGSLSRQASPSSRFTSSSASPILTSSLLLCLLSAGPASQPPFEEPTDRRHKPG